ncbi:class I SAM-dependent methyltransferase [Spirilliplanes yamanashiensis]|uniref:Transcriptional regulator n=1 Tax=Spirilliplanes yamanashiensis TaxID=42233 RepID=A0A8J3Y543_9ACTN|nr:methyltransferase domain-containing protein [Spirilliplanes yamanashiensis]MDP9819211.1 2-polyprenyl-3-methyl-5-hydroxy-6-metoxy-1,4-benzoquinol methylase [Spirilliplanes yamanashiensis]GIJ01966.1 transcriptional regulator [Spirilliplanes yamanashiensis]
MTDPRAALADRLFDGLLGAMELQTVHLGLQLGLYAALRAAPLTAAELAKAAGADERYAREWLEQQATAGLLGVDDAAAAPDARRYALDAGTAEVLLDEASPFYFGTPAGLAHGLASTLDGVQEAFRSGGGVPYADFGPHIRHGIAGFNRPMFAHQLATEWFPAVPGLVEKLTGAAVLDLGCGLGHSSVAMALAYPSVTVRGVDLDEASVAGARRTAAAAGVADRVSFTRGDAAEVTGSYDVVTIFEALHDMSDPVGTLRAARAALAPGGMVVVADDKALERFTPGAEPVERLILAFSVLHCLPATRAENGPTAHGTALRPDTLRAWAAAAGFTEADVLDVPNDFFRFYRLAH